MLYFSHRPGGEEALYFLHYLLLFAHMIIKYVKSLVIYIVGTIDIYSRVPLMRTPNGRAKSVHISEPSAVVDTLSCGHLDYIGKINGPGKKCPLRRSVHIGGLSTAGTLLLLSVATLSFGTIQ